ncbi:MAG: DUF4249 family protein [Ignavibacteriales bacterium]|nr:DUF4249 family protein [Ignavibacteriales bacterium]
MKKSFFATIIFITIILTYSCEENFDPFGELKDKYVLNCIIRGDSTFQTATLGKNYMVENYDPYSNSEDNSIKGAVIRLWNGNDIVTIMKDSTAERPENSSYKKPYSVYYTNSFQPLQHSSVDIEAILPNGKRLKSSADVPSKISAAINTDRIPTTDNGDVELTWNSDQRDPVFVVRVGIYYYKHENGLKKRYVKSVPLYYAKDGNKEIPVYSAPLTNSMYSVSVETITKTMELISEGDIEKGKYEILSCIAEVLSLNQELSKYYNSTVRGLDPYSVKLDETDYSNIENGYGIFGVYMRSYRVIKFTHKYIESFGYKPGLSDVN